MTITPKQIYLLFVLLGSVLLVGDHLTSTALTDVGSPSDLGNACAPCGAPCTDTKTNSSFQSVSGGSGTGLNL